MQKKGIFLPQQTNETCGISCILMALLAFGQKKLPFDFAAYSFVYTAVVLAPTWLLSGPRYLYALAPLSLLQARAHRGRHAWALTLSFALLMIWIFGYTLAVEVL